MTAIVAWRDRTDADPRHDERTAAILGIALGASFTICFLTGAYSHLAQHPESWFHLPASPAGLYRVTQGVHVATGIAAVPLLLAKLWAVFPRLLAWPPFVSVAHAVERLALLPLVGGALFMLFSGVANIDLWYPLPFFFPTAHYWMAWITMGALIVHIGAKIATTRRALSRSRGPVDAGGGGAAGEGSRRRFLTAVGAGAGLLTLTTVGQTVAPLQRLALLAPRHPDTGTQGFPVNRTAVEAGIVDQARSGSYRLIVKGRVARPLDLSLAEVRAVGMNQATLSIACVEGWSATRRWGGVRVRDLLEVAGAEPDTSVEVSGLEEGWLYGQSTLDPDQARARDTLLAMEVDGEPLALDHGFPIRLIGPNRPGVMQTKWVTSLEVR
ncbi:MAG: molybdopterin-dependent oxidoreductase [Acidimicrobiales bacterium]